VRLALRWAPRIRADTAIGCGLSRSVDRRLGRPRSGAGRLRSFARPPARACRRPPRAVLRELPRWPRRPAPRLHQGRDRDRRLARAAPAREPL